MKSGKQKKNELKAKRQARAEEIRRVKEANEQKALERRISLSHTKGVRVNPELLAPNNSYGEPDFVSRGFYLDVPFRCEVCGASEIWKAAQQKWWYEVAKGYAYSRATRCASCRRKERNAKRDQLALQNLLKKVKLTDPDQLEEIANLYLGMGSKKKALEYFRRAKNKSGDTSKQKRLQSRIEKLLPE